MATRELLRVRGIEKTSAPFRRELIRMSDRLEANPGYLAAVMSFETAGSFDPAQPHLGGGSARGLIQFMPFVARKLGTTSAELEQMTGVEQLAFVEEYYRRVAGGRLNTISDHYLAVFAPIGVGKPASAVMYRAPTKEYKMNKPLDKNGDGTITVGEAAAPVIGIVRAAEDRAPLLVEMDVGPGARLARIARAGAPTIVTSGVLGLRSRGGELYKLGLVTLLAALAFGASRLARGAAA